MRFRTEIRRWRKSRGLYMKEACDKLGVSMNTYKSWESGFRKPHSMSLPEIRRRMATVPLPAPVVKQSSAAPCTRAASDKPAR